MLEYFPCHLVDRCKQSNIYTKSRDIITKDNNPQMTNTQSWVVRNQRKNTRQNQRKKYLPFLTWTSYLIDTSNKLLSSSSWDLWLQTGTPKPPNMHRVASSVSSCNRIAKRVLASCLVSCCIIMSRLVSHRAVDE